MAAPTVNVLPWPTVLSTSTVMTFLEVVGGGDLMCLDAQHVVLVGGENMGDGHVQVDGEGGQTQGDQQRQLRRQVGTDARKHRPTRAARSRRPARHESGRARQLR